MCDSKTDCMNMIEKFQNKLKDCQEYKKKHPDSDLSILMDALQKGIINLKNLLGKMEKGEKATIFPSEDYQ